MGKVGGDGDAQGGVEQGEAAVADFVPCTTAIISEHKFIRRRLRYVPSNSERRVDDDKLLHGAGEIIPLRARDAWASPL